MDEYAEVIGNEASFEDYCRIAEFFESTNNHFKAGQFFLKGRHYTKV